MNSLAHLVNGHPELFRSREVKTAVLNEVIKIENEALDKIRAVLLKERLLMIGASTLVSIDTWYAEGVKCYFCGEYNEPQRLHVVDGHITLECKYCAQSKGIDNMYNK